MQFWTYEKGKVESGVKYLKRNFSPGRKDETVAWLLWYNRARLPSTLAYVSPMQFEQEWLANQPRQANS